MNNTYVNFQGPGSDFELEHGNQKLQSSWGSNSATDRQIELLVGSLDHEQHMYKVSVCQVECFLRQNM